MICFSKYDIKELESKTITYGNYGIAFSEKWQRKNGINSVLYIDSSSSVATALSELLVARQNNETSKLPTRLRLPVMTIKCFTKNSIGFNSYFNKSNFKFFEEYEWRYVPRKRDIGNGYISLNRSTYHNKKTFYNNRLTAFALKFKVSNVEAIFVNSQKEIEELVNTGNIERSKLKLSNWKTKSI